ncbi:MAG: hypothetical protein V2J42_05190 [Wenzhouxiangella sp.]|jgi:hypothetical protein|nr:hypothetical protein [Wenzhouxiangella sp.]
MTRDSKSDKEASAGELQALYDAQAEVEPDSGLDRIVLARAEQGLETRRPQRPRPWIAGLATAGVLVLTVGIIVQQAPSPLEQQTNPAAPAGGVDMEPALQSAPQSAPISARSAAEIQSRSAPAPSIAAESAFISGLADAEPESEPPIQRLNQIRKLLAAGEIDTAVIRLKALRTEYPQLEIPEELRYLLESPPE